jgi:hypothetical protein
MLSPVKRAAWLVLVSLAGSLVAQTASAVPVRVRGGSTLEARVTRDGGSTRVVAKLVDDGGSPLVGAEVRVGLSIGGKEAPLPEPRSCARGAPTLRPAASGEVILRTSDTGETCLSLSELPAGASVRFVYDGDELREGVRTDRAALQEGLATVALTLEDKLSFIDLDEPRRRIAGRLTLTSGRARSTLSGLELTAHDENDRELGKALTSEGGAFAFDLESAALGDPGPGELTLRFSGTPELGEARLDLPVFRRAIVNVTLEREPEASDPEDGASLNVRVNTLRGAVTEGVIEAMLDGASVGTGSVTTGASEVIATFARGRNESAELVVGYVPSSPWYVAGPPLSVRVPIAEPSRLVNVALAVIVLGIAVWVGASWRRSPKPQRSEEDARNAPPSGRPGLHVVRPTAARSGWSGTVVDAHDGSPIAGATLRIVAPSFEGDGVLVATASGEQGEFTLASATRGEARLLVSSPEHSDFEQALPPPSVMTIALVTRRRALIARLVRWARQQGAPFDGPPEPTPGHVRRAAARAGAPQVSSWAEGVEHAAFGPDDVDAAEEERLREREPKPLAGG